MSVGDQDQIASIRTIVLEHYEKDSSPLLLAELGKRLRDQNLWVVKGSDGPTLREVIEKAGNPDLLIVRDRNSPAYVAVVTAAAKQAVETWIENRSRAKAKVPDLEALPRSVLLAFCVRVQPGQCVFLHKTPPFKYEITSSEHADLEQCVQVEERYRRPGLEIGSRSELSASDRLDLQTKIAKWSEDKGIPIETFNLGAAKRSLSALERLLAAQPPGTAERMMIPGDIALLLSRRA